MFYIYTLDTRLKESEGTKDFVLCIWDFGFFQGLFIMISCVRWRSGQMEVGSDGVRVRWRSGQMEVRSGEMEVG
jgi:hypothetical protein